MTEEQLKALSDDIAQRVTARIQGEVIRPSAPVEERLVSVEEVCEQLSISRTTLWHLRRQGRLASVNLGRAVRFRASDVEALTQR